MSTRSATLAWWISLTLAPLSCSSDESAGGRSGSNGSGGSANGVGGMGGAYVPPATCGNGTLDLGEECDGAPVGTCSNATMGSRPLGTLACSGCRHDPSGCSSASGAGGVGTGGASGTSGTSGTSGSSGLGGAPPSSGCLQAGSGDYAATGPYGVLTLDVDLASRLPGAAAPTTYRIFYPASMEANCGHPIVAWGNGTTVTGSDVYAFYQNNAASWGVVVIAADNPNSASAPFLATGIDYLLEQARDPASPFYGKLSGRAGTSGHSQGALAATSASTHAAVEAEVQVQGGGRPKAGIAFLALTGTADNIVGTTAPRGSYDAATGPAMFANYEGADHISTPTLGGWAGRNPGTVQYMRFYTAWWRCFLADDGAACALFKGGATCGVCNDPGWAEILTKNM